MTLPNVINIEAVNIIKDYDYYNIVNITKQYKIKENGFQKSRKKIIKWDG